MRRPELTVKQILAWADAYHERTGQWPSKDSGRVWEPADEVWRNVDNCLRLGLRGLRRGQSLAKLLAKHRGKRNRKALPRYTIPQILKWADTWQTRTGVWPHNSDGPVPGTKGETWWAVDMALRKGLRGMPGGSSLAQLLDSKRGVRNQAARPPLTTKQILRWADEHYQRTDNWPTASSGSIRQSQGDTWYSVVSALSQGIRGLRKSTLGKLLGRHRGFTRYVRKSPLTIGQILAWADEHNAQTGSWPTGTMGAVPGTRETWRILNQALAEGKRGLPGGETLAVLLAKHRGRRTRVYLPPLSEALILRWAHAYKRRHGRWPTRDSGTIFDGQTWCGADMALKAGRRGLKGGSSLSQLLHAQH